MSKLANKRIQAQRRARRTRSQLVGTAARPRLSVFKSNLYISAQLIDDLAGRTLVGVHSKSLKVKGQKTTAAQAVGQAVGQRALELKIKSVVFDRGPYPYQGRVKALAEAARQAGLEF